MRSETTRILLALAGLGLPGASLAAPPVEVDVVVDGVDGAEASERTARSSRQTTVKAKTPGEAGAATVNTQTQVVNIRINGEEVTAEPEPAPAPPTPPPAPAAAPRPAEDTFEPMALEEETVPWWRDRAPGRGSVVLTGQAGTFNGFGIEGYVTDVVGLHFDVGFSGLDLDDDDVNLSDTLEQNGFGLPAFQNGDIARGFTYMLDAGPRFHVLPKNPFDIFLGTGLSWFGYHLEPYGERTVYGGSALVRLSGGMRWHFNRFVLGFDASWHPIELARFQSRELASGGQRLRRIDLSDNERFRGDRYSVVGRMGIRF